MTRINVIPVEELTRQHLQGEYKEITRVFGLVRKAQDRKINKYNFHQKVGQPNQYTLGSGHVRFFYNKLGYILKRYNQLSDEMRKRGYNPNQIPDNDLISGIDKFWLGDYTPTLEAIEINKQRINDRLNNK